MPEQQVNLDHLDVVIRRHDGDVIAAIPQVGLFARGETIEAALEQLEAKRKAVEAEMAAFATLSASAGPTPDTQSIRWREVKEFAVKAGIVLALLFAAMMYGALQVQQIVDSAGYNVRATVERVVTRGGSQFWTKLERELDRLAQPGADLPEAKKQKLLANIRTIVDRWRPFVTEAGAIFVSKNASSDQGAVPVPK